MVLCRIGAIGKTNLRGRRVGRSQNDGRTKTEGKQCLMNRLHKRIIYSNGWENKRARYPTEAGLARAAGSADDKGQATAMDMTLTLRERVPTYFGVIGCNWPCYQIFERYRKTHLKPSIFSSGATSQKTGPTGRAGCSIFCVLLPVIQGGQHS